MQITVTQIGRTPSSFLKVVEEKFLSVQEANRFLGGGTRDRMKEIIKGNTKRPGSVGTLAESIKAYEINANTVGVGKVSELPIYWAAQNFGSGHLVGKRVVGHFSPGNPFPDSGSFRAGRLIHHSTGIEPFIPIDISKPIPPMNYIQKTVNWLNTVWRIEMNKALNKVTINIVK